MIKEVLLDKRGRTKIIAGLITFVAVTLLILSGPAQALKFNLTGFANNEYNKGQLVSTTASIKIQSNERVNLDEIAVYLDNSPVCYFNPYTGNPLSGCNGITIEIISNSLDYGYGYGYSYGEHYEYGYSKGYSDGILKYKLTFDTNYISEGTHKIKLITNLDIHVYESKEKKIKIKEKTCPSKDNLQLYLPFNGNADDESGNGNNGIVNGAVLTTDRNGNANSAYYFDENDYIKLGTSNFNLDKTNEYTLSFWINAKNTSFNSGSIMIKGQYAYPFWIYLQSGSPYHNSYVLKSGVRTDNTYYLSSNPINFDEWHHVIVTYKNGKHTIYIDSSQKYSESVTGNLGFGSKSSNKETIIGKKTTGTGSFEGIIDDIIIYNKSLNPKEILELCD